MGIGVGFFTEAVGAGPRKHMDILGLGMNDGASLRMSPTGKAQLAISVQTQGEGHETTFAQIVSEELGIPPDDVDVVHGDTDTTPYGLGTYGSRSTPVSGAATAIVARKVRERARIVAAAMLEAAPADPEWQKGPPARLLVHGGLTDGVGIALMEELAFDEEGNCLGGSLMDYLIPTSLEVPDWETDFTVTPSPHHPIGAKGIGESATVGSPPTIVNAICDALGVRHIDMPCTPSRVWEAMNG